MRRLFALFLALPAHAEPGAVVQVPYDLLARELSEIIDFEDYPARLSPGLNLDQTLFFEGASIGERFAGQITHVSDGYDTLVGLPQPPLAVLPGAAGHNLTVTHIFVLSTQLQGLAPPGFPDRDAGGEGAVAILFEQDQRALGFRVAAEPRPDGPAPQGRMTVAFLDRQGQEIDRLEVLLDWGRQGYGFARTGAQADIAGITIVNRDPGGIAIDDIVFDLLRAGA